MLSCWGLPLFLPPKINRLLSAICELNKQFCQQLPLSLLPSYPSLCALGRWVEDDEVWPIYLMTIWATLATNNGEMGRGRRYFNVCYEFLTIFLLHYLSFSIQTKKRQEGKHRKKEGKQFFSRFARLITCNLFHSFWSITNSCFVWW